MYTFLICSECCVHFAVMNKFSYFVMPVDDCRRQEAPARIPLRLDLVKTSAATQPWNSVCETVAVCLDMPVAFTPIRKRSVWACLLSFVLLPLSISNVLFTVSSPPNQFVIRLRMYTVQ